jgi:hypothetical protein
MCRMDVLLGERVVWDSPLPFGLSVTDRRRHMHVVGQTGTGKSTLLRNLLIQDIEAGRGCMLLDPHGDLAQELLDHIPPWRTEDLLYFAPGDLAFPLGFNLLESVPADERPLVASSVVAVFRHLWADNWGPRLEYILYQTIAALLDFPPGWGSVSLLAVPRMFTDGAFREQVVRGVRDPQVRAFWEHEFPGFSPHFRAEAVSPIQNKVGALLAAPAVRNVLGQSKSTVRLSSVMDGRKIFICNLSKGVIGEDKCNLLGSLLVTTLQLAAMRRAAIPEAQRVDFVCYLDEFHNFVTDSFESILSEARKYHLSLVTAGQYLDQASPALQAAIFGNVGSLVSFRVGHTDAEVLSAEMAPYSAETLRELGRGEVCARITRDDQPTQPFIGKTFAEAGRRYGRGDIVIEQSRRRYGRRRVVVEDRISRWLTDRPKDFRIAYTTNSA